MFTSVLFLVLPCVLAAPLIQVGDDNVVAGKYIIKLKSDAGMNTKGDLRSSISAEPDFDYSLPGFRGFAGSLTENDIVRLQASDQVEYIQEDSIVHISTIKQQGNATWGLSRLSYTTPGSTTYSYDDTAGAGTCSYVVDTGIFIDHPEFGGRATFLQDFSGENLLQDGNGHGTHVAGTIGSITWGVAKKTSLFAVKVLDTDGYGSNAGVLAGLNYVATDAKSRTAAGECPNGVVSNMSLGGRKTKAINDAAAALVASGVFLAVAAGNEGNDAKSSSPASEPTVCTVGATNSRDEIPVWSNWGSLVDILAPGENITSSFNNGGIETISGTSMATPHIAGLGAYLLGLGLAKVETLCETIAEMATAGAINEKTLPPNTVNLLAYNGAAEELRRRRRVRV